MKSEKNVAGKCCPLARFGVNPHNHIIDVLMALDMVLLFVVQGGHWMPHRVLGIGLCVLLAVHVYQHRKWFVAFRRGKWTRKRVTRMLPIAAAALLLIGIVLGFLIPSGGEGSHAGLRVDSRAHAIDLHHVFVIVGTLGVVFHVVMQVHPRTHRRVRKERP